MIPERGTTERVHSPALGLDGLTHGVYGQRTRVRIGGVMGRGGKFEWYVGIRWSD